MKALEKGADVRAALARWREGFKTGAQVIGRMAGQEVLWHDNLQIWGTFGRTRRRGSIERSWNPFGQKPFMFRSSMIVEINPPPEGVDHNLQGVFAVDDSGIRWVLHQGRMSVPGSRVTEADFINATGLQPIEVKFADGSRRDYHRVSPLDAPPALLQESVAAFVARCAIARLSKTAPPDVVAALARVQDWERGLSPEATGEFEVAARGIGRGRHRHGEVWRALSAELTNRRIAHSNDRVARYGPDIFTYNGPDVLFEIKANATPRDIFEGLGQLQIYEQLLRARFRRSGYRKALVVPQGMRAALEQSLAVLGIIVISYERSGRSITFDRKALRNLLR